MFFLEAAFAIFGYFCYQVFVRLLDVGFLGGFFSTLLFSSSQLGWEGRERVHCLLSAGSDNCLRGYRKG